MRSFTEHIEAFRIAFAALKANKARGILTTLGIIIGIVAVGTTMTAANGLANNFRESISAIGSDVFYVSKRPWVMVGNFFEFRNRPNLSYKDGQKLEQRLVSAVAVNPNTSADRDIKYRSTVLNSVNTIGTSEKYIQITGDGPEYGRFLTSLDVQYKKRNCVIGSEIKDRLFKDIDPINKKIKIGWYTFRIVGVMEKRGSAGFFGGPNFDNQIFVPITSFLKYFGGAERNFTISVKAGFTMMAVTRKPIPIITTSIPSIVETILNDGILRRVEATAPIIKTRMNEGISKISLMPSTAPSRLPISYAAVPTSIAPRTSIRMNVFDERFWK